MLLFSVLRFFFFLYIHLDVEFTQLLAVYGRWCICHKVHRTLGLRECNHVTDGVTLGHEHEHTVNPDCQATVWWCTVFERIQEHAEAFTIHFFGKTEKVKHITAAVISASV